MKKNRCHICSRLLRKTGVYIYSPTNMDVSGLRCINCLTIYGPDFEIISMGIPETVGYA
tara:strand:- start:5 stop:181 length:177 start_codon:yes stop_codon:yes gene_type:complete